MAESTTSDVQRLESELLREKRLTGAIYALHTSLDLDELLARIVDVACEGVGADRGTVFVLDAASREIWSRSLRGSEHFEIRLPLGQGIAGTVAGTGETIRIDDAYEDERFDQSWDRTSGYRTRQVLCTPIRNREGAVSGVFQLLNKAAGTFDDADEEFLAALSVHAALALENAQLHLQAVEQARQHREILLVQGIQRAYMPERSSVEWSTVRAAGMNLLCEDASGDYYDFIPLARGRQGVVIGDVSGHGLRSALVMAQARAFLRAYCDTLTSLAEVFDRLDAALSRDLSGGLFMSMVAILVDPATGELEWTNAGHPAPLHLSAAGTITALNSTGRILGVLPEPSHRCGAPLVLAPGDVLLLYTDGATEAFNADGAQFGEERLGEVLRAHAGQEPAAIISAVHAALCRWKGVEHMEDDLTMVVLQR